MKKRVTVRLRSISIEGLVDDNESLSLAVDAAMEAITDGPWLRVQRHKPATATKTKARRKR